ncbi:hypothetical protein PQX77_019311 [Marasmius sp. AFHP31]|nr:hypothetical protein PQX77_019311 [Marasmius sp. AFHP31]
MADNETSDMSDTETMCSASDMSETSDTLTAVDAAEFPDPPIDPLFYLNAPLEPYLAQKRYHNFREYKRNHPREFALLPPPNSIEFAFNDLVNATSRAFLTALATSPSRTIPGTTTEFQIVARDLGVHLDTSIPPTDCGSMGNHLEVKRMMLASVRRFAEVWQNSLPDGVDKKLLFKDILKFIREKAEARRKDDGVKLRLGEEIFRYRDADWRDVLEQDLETSRWTRWKNGALP